MSSAVRYRPRSLAVVGASPSRFVGRIALENCRALGYPGRLVAVTPTRREVAGVAAVPSPADLDEPVDLALVQVRADRVLGVVEEGVAGVRGFVVPGAGATPYIGTVSAQLGHGTVGLVAQSGAVVEAFVDAGPRVPLPTAISSGSEAVLTLADHLRFFAADPETTAVLAFVEAVADAAETRAP